VVRPPRASRRRQRAACGPDRRTDRCHRKFVETKKPVPRRLRTGELRFAGTRASSPQDLEYVGILEVLDRVIDRSPDQERDQGQGTDFNSEVQTRRLPGPHLGAAVGPPVRDKAVPGTKSHRVPERPRSENERNLGVILKIEDLVEKRKAITIRRTDPGQQGKQFARAVSPDRR